MIIDFPVNKETYTEYCLNCHQAAGFSEQLEDGKKVFLCESCHTKNARKLIIDPKLNWWLDDQGHYCHESVGSVLINPKSEILFFELTKPPYGLTFPAGHVDVGETPLQALIRETKEEVGIDIKGSESKLVGETMIEGDSCRRGSDDHKWTLFATRISGSDADKVVPDAHEGNQARWVAQNDIDQSVLAPAIKILFEKFGTYIEKA
jgi:8-oxo-dGTP pyrophosphatase MutT (NUDIX family)